MASPVQAQAGSVSSFPRSGSLLPRSRFGGGGPPQEVQVARTGPFLYIDLSNLFVGAAQVSAARLGWASTAAEAAAREIADTRIRIKFGALKDFLVGRSAQGARCTAFGSVKDEGDTRLTQVLRRNGIEARMLRRSPTGREKDVDTSLVVTAIEDLLLGEACAESCEVTLVSGDRDMCSMVRSLRRHAIAVDVAAWRHTASAELLGLAKNFVALDDYFDLLTYREDRP